MREEIVLHLLRDLQLALHALLLALLFEQALERLRHGVERSRERAKLVAALHLDAMREVAAVDGGGGAIEIADGIGDGAVEADRHDEGDELDDGEEGRERDESVADPLTDNNCRSEEVRVEQGRPRRDIHQTDELFSVMPFPRRQGRGKGDAPIQQKRGRGQRAAAHGACCLRGQLLSGVNARSSGSSSSCRALLTSGMTWTMPSPWASWLTVAGSKGALETKVTV